MDAMSSRCEKWSSDGWMEVASDEVISAVFAREIDVIRHCLPSLDFLDPTLDDLQIEPIDGQNCVRPKVNRRSTARDTTALIASPFVLNEPGRCSSRAMATTSFFVGFFNNP